MKFFFKLILIIFISLMASCSFYNKRSDDIITKDDRLKNKTSQKELKAMNNVFVPEYVDSCGNREGEIFKILIVGNSLSYHGVAKEIGWNHISGMAASSQEKDYAHLLFKKLEEKLPDKRICLRIYPMATFERDPGNFKPENIDDLVKLDPDIIVFQLGENVGIKGKDEKLFKKKTLNSFNFLKKTITR